MVPCSLLRLKFFRGRGLSSTKEPEPQVSYHPYLVQGFGPDIQLADGPVRQGNSLKVSSEDPVTISGIPGAKYPANIESLLFVCCLGEGSPADFGLAQLLGRFKQGGLAELGWDSGLGASPCRVSLRIILS